MQQTTLKKEPKYVTMPVFERSMRSISRSFDQVFERFDRHDKIFEMIFKQFRTNNQEAHEFRMLMTSLGHSDIYQERKIEGLETRIEKLEKK